MRSHTITLALVAALCSPAVVGGVLSGSGFAASTDRVAYSGSVARFATEAEAIANSAPTAGPFQLPARATDAPFNTQSRDLGLFVTSNFTPYADANPADDYANSNIFLTAWYYSNVAGEDRYGGAGNPSNDNQGFVQLFDQDGSTTVTKSASFADFDGTNWASFNLNASGTNADFTNDLSRLWNADAPNDFPDVTFGAFTQWSLQATFGGLQGQETSPGVVEAFNHPTSVTGAFSGVFFNDNTIDPAFQGWYRVDLTLNLDSWAFGQGDSLVGGPIDESYFAVIPAPGVMPMFALAGIAAARARRRR